MPGHLESQNLGKEGGDEGGPTWEDRRKSSSCKKEKTMSSRTGLHATGPANIQNRKSKSGN